MRKTVIVMQKKEIILDIPDEMLTDENLQIFQTHINPIDSIDDVFKYAAESVFDEPYGSFIEGLGPVSLGLDNSAGKIGYSADLIDDEYEVEV